jgi:hypothetical protein
MIRRDKLKLGNQQTEAKLRVYSVTGTFHGSMVQAPTEGLARRAFHKFYNGESIIVIKLLNRIP